MNPKQDAKLLMLAWGMPIFFMAGAVTMSFIMAAKLVDQANELHRTSNCDEAKPNPHKPISFAFPINERGEFVRYSVAVPADINGARLTGEFGNDLKSNEPSADKDADDAASR